LGAFLLLKIKKGGIKLSKHLSPIVASDFTLIIRNKEQLFRVRDKLIERKIRWSNGKFVNKKNFPKWKDETGNVVILQFAKHWLNDSYRGDLYYSKINEKRDNLKRVDTDDYMDYVPGSLEPEIVYQSDESLFFENLDREILERCGI
jgi:hypothetical protein